MENISFDLYKLFYTVANSKTISEAAEKLYITQPAVTQSIKKLEDQLGGQVIYRSNKGISLTEEGQRLYNYMENSIQTLDNTYKTFSKYINLEEGKIKIRSGNIEEKRDLYGNISRFMHDHPNIDVQIYDGMSSKSIEELAKGEIDLAIFNLPFKHEIDKKINITKIKKSSLELYCSEEYYNKYIEKKDNISLKDLSNLDFIFAPKTSNTGKKIKSFLDENDIDIKSRFYSPDATEREFMAENSHGILIAIKGSVHSKKMKNIKIKDKLPEIEIGMATLNDDIIGFATKELKKYIIGEK